MIETAGEPRQDSRRAQGPRPCGPWEHARCSPSSPAPRTCSPCRHCSSRSRCRASWTCWPRPRRSWSRPTRRPRPGASPPACCSSTSPLRCSATASWWSSTPCTTARISPKSGELTGLGTEGVIAAHSGQLWTVAFAGFAPGFGYMVGENQALEVPRRSSPRTAVPAGSVALAGNYSAVYPRSSPGGWQLIGRTGARMWDLGREQPALASPRPPRAVPRGPGIGGAGCRNRAAADPPRRHGGSLGLRIVSPGLQSLIQDLGRHGHSALGVSAAGALDRASLRRANRLVGNAPSAAAIETVAGGLTVQAVGDQVLAVAGAPSELAIESPSDARDPGRPRTVPMATPFALLDGETLQPRCAGARLPQLPRRPRRRGCRPGAGQPLHGHHVRDRPGPAGRRAAACRRRGGRIRRRRSTRNCSRTSRAAG